MEILKFSSISFCYTNLNSRVTIKKKKKNSEEIKKINRKKKEEEEEERKRQNTFFEATKLKELKF